MHLNFFHNYYIYIAIVFVDSGEIAGLPLETESAKSLGKGHYQLEGAYEYSWRY